jgi:hypothetical protein
MCGSRVSGAELRISIEDQVFIGHLRIPDDVNNDSGAM